jgi:hypothetical protein
LGIGETPPDHPSPLLLPFPHKVVSIGALSNLITVEGTVYTWGYASDGRLGGAGVRSRPEVVLEGGEFGRAKLPKEAEEWITVFRWLFLGIRGEGSAFCLFPVEVVYNFVSKLFLLKITVFQIERNRGTEMEGGGGISMASAVDAISSIYSSILTKKMTEIRWHSE